MRGQSTVIGVALLIAVTVVAVAGMTVGVGTVVEERAETATGARVAAGLADALDPRGVGRRTTRVPTPGGGLRVVDRTVRIVAPGGVVRTIDAGGVVYDGDGARAAFVAGAVVRGRPSAAAVTRPPDVAARGDTLVVGVSTVGSNRTATDAPTTVVGTNTTHHRWTAPPGDYRIAVETRTPAAVGRAVPEASVTRRTLDDDAVPSVVVDPPGRRRLVLTEHRLRVRLHTGGAA